LGEVGLQHVGVDDLQPRLGGELAAEVIHQFVVHLNGHHAGGALQEFFGERPFAGADFHHEIFRSWAHRRGNALKDGTFN
jgi:hypothetical protein